MRLAWVVILSLILASGSSVITALVVDRTYYAAAQGDAKYEQQYYRGVYDTCLQRTLNSEYCESITFQSYKNDWFNKPSAGFKWLDIKDGSLESGYLR